MMTAPTSTIETVSVVRPLKVLALLCLVFGVILQIVAVLTTFWLRSGGSRLGLFELCTTSDRELLAQGVVNNAPPIGQCGPSQYDRGSIWFHAYVKAVAALLVIAGLLLVASTGLTMAGLNSSNFSRKYLYYRLGMYFALFAVLLNLVSLLTFPVCFYMEMKTMDQRSWEFDWSYGMAWGSTLFAFSASLLLICDKEHEEIYYKEKIIYNAPPENA